MRSEAAIKRLQKDRRWAWVPWGILVGCWVLSWFGLDPLDAVSKEDRRVLVIIILAWIVAGWIKTTIRKIMQEELHDKTIE